MVLIIGWFVLHLPRAWQHDAPATAGTLLVLLVDGAGVVLGGSFWRPYLFAVVPSVVALCGAAGQAPRRCAAG